MLFTGAAAFAVLSCQVILGLDEPAGVARPDAELEAEVTIVDPCQHALPPPEPAVDDDPSAGSQQYAWFATEQVMMPLKPDAGIQPGLDLDNSCTCQSDLFDGAAPCRSPKLDDEAFCDYNGGVDDSFGKTLVNAQVGTAIDISDPINRSIQTGARGLLIYLAKYNGKANDQDVGVAFVASGGLYSNLGCDGGARDAALQDSAPELAPGGKQYAPVWDGCDRWSPHDGRVSPGDHTRRAPLSVVDAYVSNYVLVTRRINEVALDIYGVPMRLTNGYFVARLTPGDGERFRMEGVVAGRMPFDDLLNAAGRANTTTKNEKTPLCESGYWPVLKPVFCQARDTMTSRAGDFKGEVCDAVSATIGLVARRAEVSDSKDDFTNAAESMACSDSGPLCE